jgi:uncharacterized phiE125 gp8 family phage protein
LFMLLVKQTTVPGAALPVAALKDHMHLGTGFADDGAQDAVIENYLRAAIAAVEARTGKVLVSKSYTWTLTAWREPCQQALPLAPVAAISEVRIVDRLGQVTIVASSSYRLEVDDQRPVLWGATATLPTIPIGGTAEIDFSAGYGPAWGNLPADLAHATFMLATHYYENRSATGSDLGVPNGVSALLARYRNIRILGGGVR